MSNQVINLDRSRKLPIKLRRGQSIDKTIPVRNADGSSFDFTGYTADLLVYNSFNSHHEEFEIVVTLSTGAIRLTHAPITRKREDFVYLLWVTDPTGYRQAWLNGPFLLLNREFDLEDGDDTLTISPDGDDVVLTISPLGGLTVSSIISALGYTPANAAGNRIIQVACSDETTALTAGTGKITFRMPHAMTVSAVRASLTTAQTSGNIFTVDINEAGASILSTKLTIDNTEKTSTTAATPAVISDASLADDAEITVDIDQIGDGTAKGLKITLIGS